MKRSKFSLSHYKLMSLDMGNLYPCGLTEVLPGDTVQQATNVLLRCSPLLAPVMHPVHVRVHHWYVPHRLVWEDFEDFITGGPDGMDASVFPTVALTTAGLGQLAVGDLGDYLGLGGIGEDITVSALPFRGYQTIWNEFYRDQDLDTEAVVDVTSGPDTTTELDLKPVAWEKDYFTSARPWEQKGAEVTIPLVGDAPVVFEEEGATPGVRTLGRSAAVVDSSLEVDQVGTTDAEITAYADLSGASSVSVNALREALALQRFQEARARYGSRYVEYLRYLGVKSSDGRLSRPEYLGGGKQTIQFSEVLQTAEGTGGGGPL